MPEQTKQAPVASQAPSPVSLERILAQLGKEHLELCLARDLIASLESRNSALSRSIETLNQTISELQSTHSKDDTTVQTGREIASQETPTPN